MKTVSRFPDAADFCLDVKEGLPEGSNLDSTAMDSSGHLPRYFPVQGSKPPVTHVHVHIDPKPSKICCTWRNGVITIAYFKMVLSLLVAAYVVYLRTLLDQVLTHAPAHSKIGVARWILNFLTGIAVDVGITLLAFATGFYGALTRRRYYVLACIILNVISDAGVIMIICILCAEVPAITFQGSTMCVYFGSVECYVYFVLIRYFWYLLKKEKLAGKNSAKDMTLSELIAANASGDPHSVSRTIDISYS